MIVPAHIAAERPLARAVAGVLARLWLEHGRALLVYLLLSLALTWPLARAFQSALIGVGDTRQLLWLLWHTKEALLGNDPLFSTGLLYYPHGSTLLANALGPLLGLVALPFWLLGAEAAYNGTLFVSFWLTGYCMYLLGRGLGFGRGTSLFVGTVLLAAPLHMIAVSGHLTKVFLGLIPLALLAAHHALDLERRAWWTAMPGIALLLTVLHSGEQFVLASLGIAWLAVASVVSARREARAPVLKRAVLVAAGALVLAGPLVVSTLLATNQVGFDVERNLESLQHTPDLLEFLLPSPFTSRLVGTLVAPLIVPFIRHGLETAVFLSWTALLLSLAGLRHENRQGWFWRLLAIGCVILALGPVLRVAGRTEFTEYRLPVIMPYALFTALPGLGFWRTPGRFMLLGYVAFAVSAGFGLDWLTRRLPARAGAGLSSRAGGAVMLLALLLLLAESVPQLWPEERLPPTPAFYEQIAGDGEEYGVLDLPLRPAQEIGYDSSAVIYSAWYQMYQMTHRKGTASGYLARTYTRNPLFGHFVNDSTSAAAEQAVLSVDGGPSSRYANAAYDLARANYRYVVWHKRLPSRPAEPAGTWAEEATREFVQQVFGEQAPLFEDDQTRVYAVPPASAVGDLTTTIALSESPFESWLQWQTGKPWAVSPALLYIASPGAELAYLDVTPAGLTDAVGNKAVAAASMSVEWAGGVTDVAAVEAGRTTTFPLILPAGTRFVTLTLATAPPETHAINMQIERLDLRTSGMPFPPPDIVVDRQFQRDPAEPLIAVHGSGWYAPEGEAWRWASSPADVWVHISRPRHVRLLLLPVAVHDPGGEKGLGRAGVVVVTANAREAQTLDCVVGRQAEIDLTMAAGWNRVSLTLRAGNFCPAEVEPGNGDRRELAFAFARLELYGE